MKTIKQQEVAVFNQMVKDLKRVTEQRDNIQTELNTAILQLNAYRGTVNMIDDYFEYRCISEDDQKQVHIALNALTIKLTATTK